MKSTSQFFRAGVGAIIVDSTGRILVLERSDVAGAWQLPQGGMEIGEEPSVACLREIQEETGITVDKLKLIDMYPDPLAYELPPEARSNKTGRGQTQYWFLYRFKGRDDDIELGAEFKTWQWDTVKNLLNNTVEFRRKIYATLTSYFEKHLSIISLSKD
jgi:putative (di)nucleoside polyphosphate hydrolase